MKWLSFSSSLAFGVAVATLWQETHSWVWVAGWFAVVALNYVDGFMRGWRGAVCARSGPPRSA